MDIFDNLSPLDYRYYARDKTAVERLKPYLSENALIKYMAKVEAALTSVLSQRKICSNEIAKEVAKACEEVTAKEVYEEEDKIKHNVRALVNCIRKRVSDDAKPYVHFTATSHDIICTAEAARYRDVTNDIVIPTLFELEKTLIALARKEKDTLQIGRTHGQHAEPITFGFTVASYVSRLGNRIVAIKEAGNNLRGKMAGAVGAYNAASLFGDPLSFERIVLAQLDLKSSTHSTQIVEPEYMTDYVHSIISAFSVLANIADDMRHLQRSEIAEVGEEFGEKQVGSSTMPHKRNPISFENVKSMYKAIMPRMMTLYLDQISEHQRDLTNSASSRFTPELVAAFVITVMRLTKTMKKLTIDKKTMRDNFMKNKDFIIAEPLYILLAYHNHPDAHEYVRKLTLKSQQDSVPLPDIIFKDKELEPYLKKFTEAQIRVLKNPETYTGLAGEKTEDVCSHWEKELKLG